MSLKAVIIRSVHSSAWQRCTLQPHLWTLKKYLDFREVCVGWKMGPKACRLVWLEETIRKVRLIPQSSVFVCTTGTNSLITCTWRGSKQKQGMVLLLELLWEDGWVKKDQVSVRVFGQQVLAEADVGNIAQLQRSRSQRPETLTDLRDGSPRSVSYTLYSTQLPYLLWHALLPWKVIPGMCNFSKWSSAIFSAAPDTQWVSHQFNILVCCIMPQPPCCHSISYCHVRLHFFNLFSFFKLLFHSQQRHWKTQSFLWDVSSSIQFGQSGHFLGKDASESCSKGLRAREKTNFLL